MRYVRRRRWRGKEEHGFEPREQGKNLLVRQKGEEHFFKTLEKTKQPYSRDALKGILKATTYRYLRHIGKKR